MRQRIDQHPNASAQQRHIPVDVLQPLSTTFLTLAAGIAQTLAITGLELFEFTALSDTIDLQFNSGGVVGLPIVAATFTPNTYRLLSGETRFITVYEVTNLHALAATGGTLIVNALSRYRSLEPDNAISKR